MFLQDFRPRNSTRSFLCMRRDVSQLLVDPQYADEFSLHAQRCFLGKVEIILSPTVFSACAEMFPTSVLDSLQRLCFLCMRRDVSAEREGRLISDVFSLHAQRCFHYKARRKDGRYVFSACAEMFLRTHEEV